MLLNKKRNVSQKPKFITGFKKLIRKVVVSKLFSSFPSSCYTRTQSVTYRSSQTKAPFNLIIRPVTMTCPNDDRSAITTVVGDCSKIKTVNQSMLLALKELNKKGESTIQIQRTIQI